MPEFPKHHIFIHDESKSISVFFARSKFVLIIRIWRTFQKIDFFDMKKFSQSFPRDQQNDETRSTVCTEFGPTIVANHYINCLETVQGPPNLVNDDTVMSFTGNERLHASTRVSAWKYFLCWIFSAHFLMDFWSIFHQIRRNFVIFLPSSTDCNSSPRRS